MAVKAFTQILLFLCVDKTYLMFWVNHLLFLHPY
jgi:hypothetical protein